MGVTGLVVGSYSIDKVRIPQYDHRLVEVGYNTLQTIGNWDRFDPLMVFVPG